MAWTAPKTTWTNQDYFNVSPDYARIKGNIEYLVSLATDIFGAVDAPTLATVTTSTIPDEDFFNNIVDALLAIQELYSPVGFHLMRRYEGDDTVWSADDLNAIEENCKLFYKGLPEVRTGLTRLSFKLGGNRFG